MIFAGHELTFPIGEPTRLKRGDSWGISGWVAERIIMRCRPCGSRRKKAEFRRMRRMVRAEGWQLGSFGTRALIDAYNAMVRA